MTVTQGGRLGNGQGLPDLAPHQQRERRNVPEAGNEHSGVRCCEGVFPNCKYGQQRETEHLPATPAPGPGMVICDSYHGHIFHVRSVFSCSLSVSVSLNSSAS